MTEFKKQQKYIIWLLRYGLLYFLLMVLKGKRLYRGLFIYGQCHSTLSVLSLLGALYLSMVPLSFLIFNSVCPEDVIIYCILKYAKSFHQETKLLWIQYWALKFEIKIPHSSYPFQRPDVLWAKTYRPQSTSDDSTSVLLPDVGS